MMIPLMPVTRVPYTHVLRAWAEPNGYEMLGISDLRLQSEDFAHEKVKALFKPATTQANEITQMSIESWSQSVFKALRLE